MHADTLKKAGMLTVVLVATFFIVWEWHLRHSGIALTYDEGKEQWADKRALVYAPKESATVFIGSSRNKFDIDIATWRAVTGENAVQLAMEGNSPLPILDDLAADTSFKGRLIIDVTEVLFFSGSPHNTDEPKKNVDYYKKRTPAQLFSFRVNHVLESQFVFLNRDHFSLNGLLSGIKIPSREGVFIFPDFPVEFNGTNFDRQCIMMDRFLTDTVLQNMVKSNWVFFNKIRKELPASGTKLDSILTTVKTDCDKIKNRGGEIIFVRTPSSGPMLEGERKHFPRAQYWGRLLATTGCSGIHFEDYPAISHFECPEFSHLKQTDAIVFTKNIIQLLEQEKGWSFPNSHSTHE